jgi:hypothetical protein
MRFKNISFLFIFLFSCSKVSSRKLFYDLTYVKWVTAIEVEIPQKRTYELKKEITMPAYTWMNLLKLTFLNKKNEKVIHCLFYKTPLKDRKKGSLKVVELKNSSRCENQFDKDAFVELKEVEKLSVDNESGLILKFIFNQRDELFHYPFYNLENEDRFKSLQRYSKSPFVRGKGVRLGPFLNQYLPLGNLKTSSNELNICQKVLKSCLIEKEGLCEDCRFGVFPVVSRNCSGTKTFVCGPINCGEKNMPACPVGLLSSKIEEGEDPCFHESPAGLCQKGLKTYCSDDHILVCL